LRALKKNKDKSVLWFNGDVVFDVKLLDILNEFITKNESFVAVNTSKVGEEEVKYTLKDGYIKALSKTVKNGLGEAVGINFISSNDVKTLINRLEDCGNNDYFERGMEMAIEKDNLKVNAVDISKFNCMEIDFVEDLNEVNKSL
jgi:choline kinase